MCVCVYKIYTFRNTADSAGCHSVGWLQGVTVWLPGVDRVSNGKKCTPGQHTVWLPGVDRVLPCVTVC